MKPLILLTLPNHWAIKNIIHSGVAKELQAFANLEVLCSDNRIEPLKALCSSLGLKPITWTALPKYQEGRLLRAVRHLQKSLMFEFHGVETEQIAKKSYRGRRTRAHVIGSNGTRLLVNLGIGGLALKLLEKMRFQLTPTYEEGVATLPSIVFTTNPVDFHEDPLLKWARLKALPIVTMVPSWDNLSNKGVLFTHLEKIMVWNPEMQAEVQKYYPDYNQEDLPVVGVPRFDIYHRPLKLDYERCELWNRLGLDSNKRTILCATTPLKTFRSQIEVCGHILEAIEAGSIADAQLLVRCHPLDDPDAYSSLRKRRNVIVWPDEGKGEEAFGTDVAPPVNDLDMLAGMILGSDVVVHAASTIALDAAVADKPIVSIAYDGDEKLDYYDSIRSAYDYTHQKAFMSHCADTLACDRSALIAAINTALANPSYGSESRHRVRQYATSGDSTALMVSSLKGILEPRHLAMAAAFVNEQQPTCPTDI